MKKTLSGPIIILLVASFFLYQTTNIKTLDIVAGLGADFYPRVILIFIIVLSALSIIISIIKNRNLKSYSDKESFSWKVLLMFISFGIYIWALDVIGFVIASTIFMMFVYILLIDKKKNWKVNIITVICLFLSALVVSFIFENYLNVFLPKGLFF
ncbi:Tripartite tricarboxylate transporter TctB family protein [Jeotgalicoccus saudimassiliensis]|uniref:Tripartite tricarboxylate transporter TctB family protein n=1 Tax=Jeotgalicoccus saudimassiliensis TaxID=1461582 RepID=A0A078M6E1_9STAP|nr:tripartite tricarboxylate transporter TctB family protein [Jeotgalicoccus saudimassiliensis]CEA03008.1 Tripartite tricarboxylate transporter TctB family protein [Jeotgalicoccus saudimassiliensis]